MAGNLKLMVLKTLEEAPASGYGIVKKIKENTGWKPSYGSIYPLLEKLEEQGILTHEDEKRKKVYCLTQKGKKKVEEMDKKKEELLESMKENVNVMSSIMGEDMSGVIQLIERVHQDKSPFFYVQPELGEFRKTFLEKGLDGTLKNNRKEIKQMLKHFTKELRAME